MSDNTDKTARLLNVINDLLNIFFEEIQAEKVRSGMSDIDIINSAIAQVDLNESLAAQLIAKYKL